VYKALMGRFSAMIVVWISKEIGRDCRTTPLRISP